MAEEKALETESTAPWREAAASLVTNLLYHSVDFLCLT